MGNFSRETFARPRRRLLENVFGGACLPQTALLPLSSVAVWAAAPGDIFSAERVEGLGWKWRGRDGIGEGVARYRRPSSAKEGRISCPVHSSHVRRRYVYVEMNATRCVFSLSRLRRRIRYYVKGEAT